MVKAIGGGSKVRIRIFSGLDIFCSKFYVLSRAFDGISKFGPVDPEFADLWGWVGSLRGYFWPSGEIQCPKSQKSVRKCTFVSFKRLNMIKAMFQRMKTWDFDAYLQAGGSTIIIVSSYQ